MTIKYCDSPIHKVSSLALAFIILAFCVLPSFVHADSVRPNEPVGWKDGDTFRDILLVVLDSWGISFSKSDSTDDTSILEYSDQLMQEFYEANETTQELFWDLVKYGADETGNLILDFLGVNKIRQFANWLVDKFDLEDNSVTPVAPSADYAYVGGVKCLVINSPNQIFYVDYGGSISNSYVPTPLNLIVEENHDYNPYPIYLTTWIDTRSPQYSIPALYFTSPTKGVTFRNALTNGSIGIAFNSSNPAQGFVWTSQRTMSVPGITPLQFSTTPSVSTLFGDGTITSVNSSNTLVINTTVINIPSDNDITPNDGLQIEVPGTNWGDSIFTILDLIERLISLYDSTKLNVNTVIELITTLLQGLQSSVTVENIPGAVILDYDDYDIPIENEWGLFDIFFNTDDDTSILTPWQDIRAIIYGFPAPVLSFFALVVLFIVAYGFIRMGRDSH